MPRAEDEPTTRIALRGRLVTPDGRTTGIDDGILYVDAGRIAARLKQPHRLLLHLAEGTGQAAPKHFLALKPSDERWAINENPAGIHCTALTGEDFRTLAGHGESMVWPPVSNLLLYGESADIAVARPAGMLIGLGSDWSISVSKGLLGELKAARPAADADEADLSDRDLVAMAIRDASRILRWELAVGSLPPGLQGRPDRHRRQCRRPLHGPGPGSGHRHPAGRHRRRGPLRQPRAPHGPLPAHRGGKDATWGAGRARRASPRPERRPDRSGTVVGRVEQAAAHSAERSTLRGRAGPSAVPVTGGTHGSVRWQLPE
ncbi:hypothetical protein ACF1BE_26630 [Streptomyces sp. NPDC014991]|uniref:amidohydrolase family protein n=1 Tax=Streptomyces sp. NPDC014991 TaxID=3364935 RepID=UPI003701DC5B